MAELTEVRRQILLNIRQGKKDPYDGFEGSQYGGARRSFQTWIGVWGLVDYDRKYETWKLTAKGAKALETGEY